MAASAFTESQQQQLLALARQAIACRLTDTDEPLSSSDDATLNQPGACFVTLKINDQLRGCIGTLEAHQPLHKDIIHNAQAAAFSDPRFTPVTAEELDNIHIDISVLTEPEPLPQLTEAQLLNRLRPHTDGLILKEGHRRATFLPSVWESLSEPQEFVRELKRKAGLPANHWSDEVRCEIYQALYFGER
jgi:AmmeMemoRadiSam system protein A